MTKKIPGHDNAIFAAAMETATTLLNATECLLTDRQHPNILQESSTDPNRLRSCDGSSQVTKFSPRSSLGPPKISNNLPQIEESSELTGPSESTNSSSLIVASSIQHSQPQRSGNVMSTKQLSSPSSSASVKSPNSRGSTGNGDEPHLVVQKQPPKYVYSNESFEVTLQLEVPKATSPSQSSLGGQEIELLASVHDEKTGRECGPEALLITQPSRIVLVAGEDGIPRCSVVCMIRMDGIRRDQGASLAVRFKTRPNSSPPIRGVVGAATDAIHLVNYKIRITPENDWGPVWYKDEGGRDKSIEIYASIYDKDGQLRTGEQIPLHSTLCYESAGILPVKVANQEILRTLGNSRVVIDKDTGQARIRFRVEDVSKNHQAQDFILMVGTDPKAKTFQDVAPDFTPAINVRSKRNKRSRNSGHNRSASDRTSPSLGRQRYDGENEGGFDPADVPRLRDALKSVINWAGEVVSGLYPLQWQVLGYAQHPDGSTDYARPYHNMPNPNPCINHVIGLYADTVRDSLGVLLNSVEHASPPSDDPATRMPVPIAPPPPPGSFAEDPMYGMMRSPQSMQMHGHAGMPPQSVPRRMAMPGGPEHFQSIEPPPMYQTRNGHPTGMMQHQQHQSMPPVHNSSYMRPPPPPEGDLMPMHFGMPPRGGEMLPMGAAGEVPMQRSLRPEEESRESEVEYVLAKQYKALRTGERLGFPAYSGNKEIIGFYREQAGSGARQFSPISHHRNDFGPLEILQATEIVEEAIKKKSDAVHSLKDWGTIDSLLNQVLVYDWRQDMGDN
jgi:hypothetical protein